jgi:hypothetical protein
MKEHNNVRYRKVWRINEKQEEQVNEDQVPEIVLTIFIVVKCHNELARQEGDDRIQEEDEVIIQEENVRIKEEDEKEDDESIDEEEDNSASEWVFSEPSDLDTPSKYEY